MQAGRIGRDPSTDDTAARSREGRAAMKGRASSAVDDVQLARGHVEGDGAVRSADHDVFDPGAVFVDEVDTRLDREDHPLAERLMVAGDDVGILVTFEADPVPG